MTVMTMNPPGTFAWMELGTTDGPRAKDFYSELFGWDVRENPMGPEFTYYIFQLGGKDVAAMYQLMPDQLKLGIPAHWLSYVAVTDADTWSAKATALGGKVVMGPQDAGEHGRAAIITDPQGATFAIWQAKSHPGVGLRGDPGSLVWNELMSTDVKAGSAVLHQAVRLDHDGDVDARNGLHHLRARREGRRWWDADHAGDGQDAVQLAAVLRGE